MYESGLVKVVGQGSLTTGLGIEGNCKVSRGLWSRPKESMSLIGNYQTSVLQAISPIQAY